jgi:surface protein
MDTTTYGTTSATAAAASSGGAGAATGAGLSTGAIVGIVIGCVVGLVLIVLLPIGFTVLGWGKSKKAASTTPDVEPDTPVTPTPVKMISTWDEAALETALSANPLDQDALNQLGAIILSGGSTTDITAAGVTDNFDSPSVTWSSTGGVTTVTINAKEDIGDNDGTYGWNWAGTEFSANLKAAFVSIVDWGEAFPWASSAWRGWAPAEGLDIWPSDSTAASVKMPTDMTNCFRGQDLTNDSNTNGILDIVEAIDVGHVTTFINCFNIDGGVAANYDVSGWDMKSATTLAGFMNGQTTFEQDLSSWDVRNVTSFSTAFYLCAVFTGTGLDQWEVTNKLTEMQVMFQGCTAFDVDLSGWDVSKVTNFNSTFRACTAFTNGGAALAWTINTDDEDGVDMSSMFYACEAFNQPLTGWDTSNVISMAYMFYFNTLDSVFNQSLNHFDVSKVATFRAMFFGANAFNNGEAGNAQQAPLTWTLSTDAEVDIDIRDMFRDAVAFNQNLPWNTVRVTLMDNAFDGATVFDGNVEDWNTANCTSMVSAFASTGAFNQSIADWDTAACENMSGMFNAATAFNNGDPGNNGSVPLSIDFTATISVASMFAGATAFNQTLGVGPDFTVCTDMSSMFSGATLFNNGVTTNAGGAALDWVLNTNTPDPGSEYTASAMFSGASAFNQAITALDFTEFDDLSQMFLNAVVFNNGENTDADGAAITWTSETAKVTTFAQMFDGATAFNQDISSWDLDAATTVTFILRDATTFDQDMAVWADNTNANSFLANIVDVSGAFQRATTFLGDVSGNLTATKVTWDAIPGLGTTVANTPAFDAAT